MSEDGSWEVNTTQFSQESPASSQESFSLLETPELNTENSRPAAEVENNINQVLSPISFLQILEAMEVEHRREVNKAAKEAAASKNAKEAMTGSKAESIQSIRSLGIAEAVIENNRNPEWNVHLRSYKELLHAGKLDDMPTWSDSGLTGPFTCSLCSVLASPRKLTMQGSPGLTKLQLLHHWNQVHYQSYSYIINSFNNICL